MLEDMAGRLMMLAACFLFYSCGSAWGAASAAPLNSQSCSPDQFMMTIGTMSTCVPSRYGDEIFEVHKNIGVTGTSVGSIFLNLSTGTERDRVCMQCHVRGKKTDSAPRH